MHRKKQNAYSKQLVNGNIFGSVHILDTGDRENEKTIFNLGRHIPIEISCDFDRIVVIIPDVDDFS